MKNKYLIILALISSPLYAQSMLSSLQDYQGSLSTSEPNQKVSTPPVQSRTETSSETNGRCEENDQTSMPLAYATSLIQAPNAKFDIDFNPRTGKVSISADSMISNCSSMVEWKLKEQEIQGQKAYVIEAKFREGENCADGKCSYKVAKVSNGEFDKYEDLSFAPTLKGFEACLQASGVVKNGKVDKKAIYSAPMKETFNDVKDTGKLLFVSHGPQSAMTKAKYGKFELINRCDHYEALHPDIRQLLSLEDERRLKLDEEANKLKDCGVDEYDKLIGFIEKYEEYSAILGSVRDELILEAVKKAASNIEEGKYSDDDLKVIADFEKYIVNPKIEEATRLFDQMTALEGDAKRAKQNELKAVLEELKALNNKPYFQAAHTQKLMRDGKFEEAEHVNGIKIALDNYRKIGSKQGNVLYTPDIAMMNTVHAKDAFAKASIIEQERYQVRTGQITGQSDFYQNMVKRLENSIQARTNNFKAEMQNEYARVQPGGYCYAYFRNTQKCIEDSLQRIQQLQNLLNHYNKVDKERIVEYQEKADDYAKLEAEGRRYVAAQNGEEIIEEAPPREAPVDTTRPPARAAAPEQPAPSNLAGTDLTQVANQLAQMYQMQQQPQMAPQMGGQWWNQQGNMYGQAQLMIGGQNPYMMQGQYQYGSNQGYWSNPYQAYTFRGF
ncbi:MAG TPA: hypothetical protein VKY27_06050 [Bacteriovoracaceae bacterium]|nr:hypothetical protein [Bacteriovoracaceae bacterium]